MQEKAQKVLPNGVLKEIQRFYYGIAHDRRALTGVQSSSHLNLCSQ